MSRKFYRFVFRFLLRLLVRITVTGAEHIPTEGACLLTEQEAS